MATTRMSGADATWLHMDRPQNLMIVNTVLWFEGEADWAQLEKLFFERVVTSFPAFRSRPVDPPVTFGLLMAPRWAVAEPNPLDHIRRSRLPPSGGDHELHHYIAREAARPLDARLPLWQLHLIEGYRDGGAVLLRTHHAMGDGPALMHVLERWGQAEPRLKTSDLARRRPGVNGPGMSRNMMKREVATMGKLVGGVATKATVLGAELGGVKAMAWSVPVPLDRLRWVSKDTGSTLNDVGLALIAGALRRAVDGAAANGAIEAILPVTLRTNDAPPDETMGNHFGLVFAPLPIDVVDVRDRIGRVKTDMDRIKSTREALTVFDALTGLGLAPKRGAQAWVDAFSRRASAVITNIVGPRRQLEVGDHVIEGMMLWVPSTGPVGLGVSICSYAGAVRFGVISDTAVMADPGLLAAAIDEELLTVAG